MFAYAINDVCIAQGSFFKPNATTDATLHHADNLKILHVYLNYVCQWMYVTYIPLNTIKIYKIFRHAVEIFGDVLSVLLNMHRAIFWRWYNVISFLIGLVKILHQRINSFGLRYFSTEISDSNILPRLRMMRFRRKRNDDRDSDIGYHLSNLWIFKQTIQCKWPRRNWRVPFYYLEIKK